MCVWTSVLCLSDPLCAGGHSENHEDEEGSEASAASGWGSESALIPVQTQSPCNQGQLILFYKSSLLNSYYKVSVSIKKSWFALPQMKDLKLFQYKYIINLKSRDICLRCELNIWSLVL